MIPFPSLRPARQTTPAGADCNLGEVHPLIDPTRSRRCQTDRAGFAATCPGRAFLRGVVDGNRDVGVRADRARDSLPDRAAIHVSALIES